MIHVDLRTRILPPDHQVFFARPGAQYRLYPEVVQERSILIDLPFLDLQPGVPIEQQPDLDARIRRSRRLRTWYRHRDIGDDPSRDLDDYRNLAADTGLPQLRAVLISCFDRAKQGDLVLVVPGAWNADALIGEFDTPGTAFSNHRVYRFYERDPLTGRSVKWLATQPRRLLDGEIIDIVQKPNAFVLLPQSVRQHLYSWAYPAYTKGDQFSARFDVREHQYRSIDDLLIQAFFNFVAANTKAVAENRDGDVVGITEGAFIDAGEFNMDLQTEISSPGFLNLSSLHVTPLVVAALFALAVQVGPEAAQAVQNGEVRIGNSIGPRNDRCAVIVQEQAMRQIRLLGLDRWGQACDKARRAAGNTGVRGPAQVRNGN